MTILLWILMIPVAVILAVATFIIIVRYRIWRALNKLESAIYAFGAALDEQDASLGNLERLTDELISNK